MIHIIITIKEGKDVCAVYLQHAVYSPTLAEKEMIFRLRESPQINISSEIARLIERHKLVRPNQNENGA